MKKYLKKLLMIILPLSMLITGCENSKGDSADTELIKDSIARVELYASVENAEENDDMSDELKEPELEELSLSEPEENSGDDGSSEETELQEGSGQITTESVSFNTGWTYADSSQINWGSAVLYHTGARPNGITVGVNAGHGTNGSTNYKTYCHPDRTAKVTGGTTAAGSVTAVAVSGGMTFNDGTPERDVTLREAQLLRDKLLAAGYDVLMIRDGDDVQLDNVARTVMCNNMADCHVAIHWDGDGLGYDKGCFFMSVPDGIKYMDPVSYTWEKSENFGWSLISGLQGAGAVIYGNGNMDLDLTQTSYSTIPSVDIELGNQSSDHSDAALDKLATGLLYGINEYFGI